jgi:23S rRNA pseudouridine1911/1915/1917 synthase
MSDPSIDKPLDAPEDAPSIDGDAEGQGEVLLQEGDETVGEHLVICVGQNLKFRRLDKYLGGRFNNFSRSRLQKLIKEQGVNVNGRPAKPSHKLNPGDKVDLVLPPREVREIIPQDIPLDIIFEDDEMIVLNKQAGIIVHPARGYKDGTLVNALVHHVQNLSAGFEDFRPGIVHRLDKNTTGVMCVAKTDQAHWKLSRQFAERTTQKTYLAVVQGVPELDSDCINQPLGVHPSNRTKYSIRPDGKESSTVYQVLEKFRGYSLVQVSPRTGRTHQIRVHMQYLKHSIVADDMYGGKMIYPWQIEDREACPEEPLMARTALHAWKLKIKHPITDEENTYQAEPPADMQRLIENLRKYRKLEEPKKKKKLPNSY